MLRFQELTRTNHKARDRVATSHRAGVAIRKKTLFIAIIARDASRIVS
jgi:hypothetical protein